MRLAVLESAVGLSIAVDGGGGEWGGGGVGDGCAGVFVRESEREGFVSAGVGGTVHAGFDLRNWEDGDRGGGLVFHRI